MIKLWDVKAIAGDRVGTFAACDGDSAIVAACRFTEPGTSLEFIDVLDYEVAELRSQAWDVQDNYLADCCHRYLFGIASDDEVENIAVALTGAS